MLKERKQTHVTNNIDLIKVAEKNAHKLGCSGGVCVVGAGGCACVSTRTPQGTGFCPSPNRGVRNNRDRNTSPSALKLLQGAALTWTLTSFHGLDPIRGNHCWFCMGRWTLRWAFVLWTSEPRGRSEPPNHTLVVCEESNLLSSVLEETTRRSEGLNSTAKNNPPELDATRKASRFRQMCVSKGSILFFSSQKILF